MKFSMIGQEKGDLSIQVTAWAGLSVYVYHISIIKYILSIILLYQTGIR